MQVHRVFRNVFRFSDIAAAEQKAKEPSFLKMVEGYFDKAARVAGLE